MSLKPSDIDRIIDLIQKIAESATKTDFLSAQEQQRLDLCLACEKRVETINVFRRLRMQTVLSEAERHAIEVEYSYDPKVSQELKCKLSKAKTEHVQSTLSPLQKKLDLCLAPRWPEIMRLSDKRQFRQDIERNFTNNIIISNKAEVIDELERIKAKLEYQNKKPAETGGNVKGNKIMKTSKENWEAIRGEYGISKMDFGKKINFVKDSFKRSVIFRDVEHAFVLASEGFSKPALILAGGVIEELLRLYLEHKGISLPSNKFVDYIKVCEQKRLLKSSISKLSDSVREFRNLVHISREESKRHTISKATAKGAVSSIFTIANDFQ